MYVYGQSEVTIFCTSYYCGRNAVTNYHRIVCIGKPLKDAKFGLFEDIFPINDPGTNEMLCIGDAQLTKGYLDDPEKNKTAFFSFDKQEFYQSGDLCHKDKEGDYFFSGRNDTQVKINGYRIEISEQEYHAGDFPRIDEVVVIITLNDKNDQQVLNLVYTAKSELNKDGIVVFLSKKITSYMLPGQVIFAKSIPTIIGNRFFIAQPKELFDKIIELSSDNKTIYTEKAVIKNSKLNPGQSKF